MVGFLKRSRADSEFYLGYGNYCQYTEYNTYMK